MDDLADLGHRVVVLIDMDCFYCQVEEGLDPTLRGQPVAVVQHNEWRGGGIIAVNYAARACGVKRHMRGDEARALCPTLRLCRVPAPNGRADISKYRAAGERVAAVLQRFSPLLERASIDEAYLDVTAAAEERASDLRLDCPELAACAEMTLALGCDGWNELVESADETRPSSHADVPHTRRLLAAVMLVREIRQAVLNDTGYECSAGVAHNKTLAKAICGFNKPNKQTVLAKHALEKAARRIPLRSLRGLGAARGQRLRDAIGGDTLADLRAVPASVLLREKDGAWLVRVARGIDNEPVRAKMQSESVGCCKRFAGAAALVGSRDLRHWLRVLATDLHARLEDRQPRRMTVSVTTPAGGASRSCALSPDPGCDGSRALRAARSLLLHALPHLTPAFAQSDDEDMPLQTPVTFLGISVGKFLDADDDKQGKNLLDFFHKPTNNAAGLPSENVISSHHHQIKTKVEKDAHNDNLIDKNRSDENPTNEVCKDELPNDVDQENKDKANESDKSPNSVSISKKPSSLLISNSLRVNMSESTASAKQITKQPSIGDFFHKKHPTKQEPNAHGEMTECMECGVHLHPMEVSTHADFHLAERMSAGELCQQCGQRVPPHLAETHADYHFARALQRQLSGEISGTGLTTPKTTSSSSTKRKPHSLCSGKDKKPRTSILNFLKPIPPHAQH